MSSDLHPDNPLYKAQRSYPVTEYVPQALNAIAPGARWRVTGEFTYEEIEWESEDIAKPTKEVVMAKAQELKDAFDNAQYARLRAVSYPSVAEQLDTLYHQGYDGWKATIDAVKEQFPKP